MPMQWMPVLVFLFAVSPVQAASTSLPPGITVEGVCHRRTVPDRGALIVTADFLEKDIKSAVSKTTDAYEKVKTAVKRLNLENLEVETSEYSVQEERVWEKDRQVPKGFRARMGLRVTSSNIQKLGEVISIAAREGIRDVGALNTYLSSEKLKQEQMACLETAATHAHTKAEKLAAALGAKLGVLVNLTEMQPEMPRFPSPVMMKASRGDMVTDAPAPSIEAGKQDISTTVYVTFSLR
jgi:uncharacterized protein YggE